MPMTYQDAENIVRLATVKHFMVTHQDGTKEKMRLFISSSGSLCKYAKRRHRYGYSISPTDFQSIVPMYPKIGKDNQWRKSWERAKSMLEKSGLWTNMLEEIEIALEVGYDKLQLASSEYWKEYNTNIPYEDRETDKVLRIKAIDSRLIEIRDGKEFANTNIIWYMSKPAKIKKMYFGKVDYTENIFKNIQTALKLKKQHYCHKTVGYDVSFSYDPSQNRAWYSEEYRGCGNGHYYLALNGTHALYYEDD